jgi:hypothetical protein
MDREQPQHKIILTGTHPSGAEEWHCPTCGRRFLMQWPPDYKKIILEQGDEFAIHTGGKGDLSMQPPETFSVGESGISDQADLAPWLDWMEKSGFGGLFSDED